MNFTSIEEFTTRLNSNRGVISARWLIFVEERERFTIHVPLWIHGGAFDREPSEPQAHAPPAQMRSPADVLRLPDFSRPEGEQRVEKCAS